MRGIVPFVVRLSRDTSNASSALKTKNPQPSVVHGNRGVSTKTLCHFVLHAFKCLYSRLIEKRDKTSDWNVT